MPSKIVNELYYLVHKKRKRPDIYKQALKAFQKALGSFYYVFKPIKNGIGSVERRDLRRINKWSIDLICHLQPFLDESEVWFMP